MNDETEKFITYCHPYDKKVRFRQYKKDPVPVWAVDIRDEPAKEDIKTSHTDSEMMDWLNNNRWAASYFSRRRDIRDVIQILMDKYKPEMWNDDIEKLFH